VYNALHRFLQNQRCVDHGLLYYYNMCELHIVNAVLNSKHCITVTKILTFVSEIRFSQKIDLRKANEEVIISQ